MNTGERRDKFRCSPPRAIRMLAATLAVISLVLMVALGEVSGSRGQCYLTSILVNLQGRQDEPPPKVHLLERDHRSMTQGRLAMANRSN